MKKETTLLWLLTRIRRRIPALTAMTLANMGCALLGVAFALGTKQVIDHAVSGDEKSFFLACVWQLGIILGMLICLWVFRYLKERLNADLERDWKAGLLHGLLNGEYASVSAYHSGELLNRMNNDVRTVNDGLLGVVPNVTAMIARLLAAVAVLAMLDLPFTICMTVLGAAVILATALLRRKLKTLHKSVSEWDGKVSGFLQETLEKLLMVQAMDVSREMEHRAEELMDQRYGVQMKRKRVSVAANMAVSCLSYGAAFLALVWCARRILAGQMTFGALTAVTQLVSQLRAPFVGLSGVFPQYIAMLASGERLMELERIQGQPEPVCEDPEVLYDAMETLRVEGLSFSYNRDSVFREAEASLPKGSFTVITGQSGIGKSTFLKLLLGIFPPDSGEICIQCSDRRVPVNRSTRRLFAYVPQGNLLISGSLRSNLTIVRPDASEDALMQAVYAGAMEEFLEQLPDGLNTIIGENGTGLSEGQAQRLAIARAVLTGAPILLLDECTSALDEATEQLVLRRLKELPGRTCIAVTHRPAAAAVCDWKLIVAEGKLTVVRADHQIL